ncbi:MAG: hypothetical protein JW838_07910 [Spirochaetes bacterium]|nr:hypothetical protein [Spirochaetota bacterium]
MGNVKWITCVAVTACIQTLSVAVLNYAVDPFQHYRKAGIFTPSENQRYENPGFAKHYDYDTVIIGSSMTENFLPSQIDAALNARSIKLCISGGSAYEHGLILGTAIATGRVDRVLWGMDIQSFQGSVTNVRYGEKLPLYLYDDDPCNDYRYLLNPDVAKKSCRILVDHFRHGAGNDYDRDRAFYWADSFVFSKESVKRAYRRPEPRESIDPDFTFEKFKSNFDVNVVPHIKRNPGIRFHLFFPPYSILAYHDWKTCRYFDAAMEFKKYIVNVLDGCPNVALYDFQADASITHDLDLYKDHTHFSPKISRFIIDSMALGRYRLGKGNVDARISTLRSQVESYDMRKM